MTFYTDVAAQPTLIERMLSAVSVAFNAAAERHAKRRVYFSTLTELEALDNRDLADLGISRSELRRIAFEAAYTN